MRDTVFVWIKKKPLAGLPFWILRDPHPDKTIDFLHSIPVMSNQYVLGYLAEGLGINDLDASAEMLF